MGTLLQDYVSKVRARRELLRQATALEKEIEAVEEMVIDKFVSENMRSATVDGMTLYLSTHSWVRPKDGDAARAVKTLLEAGLADLIVLGPQKVAKYFRETPTDQMAPEVAAAFDVGSEPNIGAREAGE